MYKLAFIDYWTLAKNFARGDTVTRWNQYYGTPYETPGFVIAVHPGIGFVDVEFPWGEERVSAEELLAVRDTSFYSPPQYETGYTSWDKDQSYIEDGTANTYNYAWPKKASIDKIASDYDRVSMLAYKLAHQCLSNGLSAIESYRVISKVGSDIPDHLIKDSIQIVFKNRQALYWVAPGRQYRMNKTELDDGLPDCPKCGTNLQKTNYKKHTKLFVCPECMFCIKPSDIEGLPTEISEIGFGVTSSIDNINPTYQDIQIMLGTEGVNELYGDIKSGVKDGSQVIIEQFTQDLQRLGFGDAVFLLSSYTADGLFDRDVYNKIASTLERVRQSL